MFLQKRKGLVGFLMYIVVAVGRPTTGVQWQIKMLIVFLLSIKCRFHIQSYGDDDDHHHHHRHNLVCNKNLCSFMLTGFRIHLS